MKLSSGLRVLSYDPGVDSGLAQYVTGDPINSMIHWQNQYTHYQLYCVLTDYEPDIIVCESFDHRAKDNANYKPVEFIGIVRMYVELWKDTKLFMQTPSYGKSYFDSIKLKKLGLYVPGKDHEDEMMAVKHMLMFLMANDAFDLRLLK